MADRPPDDRPGNHRPPPSDAAGQSVDVKGGWVRKTAGSGRVSGAVAHVSKCRRAVQRGEAITADWTQTPGMGDPGPPLDAARRSADISVVFLVPYRGRLKRPHVHCRAGRN